MNFNDVIELEDQHKLIAIRQGLDTLQWEVGDIVNDNYENVKDKTSFQYVCAAAGYYCGRSVCTIMRWARAAAFYAPEWREKYHGILTMEHYITAMGFQDWDERLARAAKGGWNEEPMSVTQMNAEAYTPPAPPENFSRPASAVVSFDTVVPAVQIVGSTPENDHALLDTIFGLIGRLSDLLRLDFERRSMVTHAVSLLREAFTETEKI